MTPEQLPAFLMGLKTQAATAVSPAANAMGSAFQDRVSNFTLRKLSHAPDEIWYAPRGVAPAYASGALARSIIMLPASTQVIATASVGPTVKYAAIQEFGGVTWPSRHKYMHWVNTGGSWYKKLVDIPAHPYMRPTADMMVLDGSLSRSAIAAYMKHLSPFLR